MRFNFKFAEVEVGVNVNASVRGTLKFYATTPLPSAQHVAMSSFIFLIVTELPLDYHGSHRRVSTEHDAQ